MDEYGTAHESALRTWLKRVGLAVGIVLLVLVALHRPLLQIVGRKLAIHFAAKENLKLELRLEGSVLGGVVLRNVHAVATGPSALQSTDIDLVKVDYSLWGLLRHGMAEFLQNIEVRNASIVLDPSKASPVPPPKPNQKFTLPAFFPDRLTLSDVNLRMAGTPNDLIVQHLSLELLPDRAGELRIAKMQLASGRAWSNVTAQTTYENRNLFLRNLVLDEGTKLAEVNIDASRIGQNKLDVAVKGTIAGGNVETNISLGAKDGAAETDINLNVEHTSVDAVRKYLQPAEAAEKRDATKAIAGAAAAAGGAEPTKGEVASSLIPPGVDGEVKKLAVKITGKADQPSSWNGTIAAEIENLAAGGATFDHATIDVKAVDGRAQINHVELVRGTNKVSLQGTADLPDTFAGFGHSPATLQLRGDLPALGEITAGLSQPITGSAEVNGQVKIANDTVQADVVLAGGPIDFGQGTVQKLVAKVNATKVMPPPETQRPYFEGLTTDVGLEATDLRAKEYAIDSVQGQLQSAGADLQVRQLVVRRAENVMTVSGRYQLPVDFARAAEQPAALDFTIAAPQVGAFWAGDAFVTGALQGSGRVNYHQALGDGYFEIFGSDLRAQSLTIPQLSLQGTTADNTVYLNDFRAGMNGTDYVAAHGQAVVQAPYSYSGALDVNIANLATLEPVLKAAGKPTELGGALVVNWRGEGKAGDFKSHGKLNLSLTNGRYADLRKLEAKIDADYTPEELNVPIVFLSSDKLLFQADARTKDGHLEISNIQIVQDKAKYANGYASIPFEWANLGTERPLIPADGKLLVNFQSENLDIQKLAKDLGTTAPVSGLANVKLAASGTLADLHATFGLQLTGLRSDQLKDFQPAVFNLGARLENKQLVVEGKFEQARLEPVQINASLPFDLAKMVEAKKFDEQTPVQANVKMPRSSVNFIRQFVPALERIDGNLALDVNVDGTIANPSLNGSADMTINAARFSNPSLPTVTNFNARLAFTQTRLELEQFRGELAGGPFTLSGRINFEKLTEPVFDLQLKADAVLVARNDNLNVRTDADISIKGPLASATVAGTVGITNSKFLKNLDLIPIGVPGRPPPAPQPPETGSPEISFPEPPLRDWKFDLKITTKDPFYIRGNLAKGSATVDMRVTGTGLKPLVDGSVRLDNVDVSLPFSRLEITRGLLYFNPQDPLNPNLEIQGTSLIQDYTVQVTIYGTADQPEAIFSSQPPLPQEDIITLLSTGVTREQLASGGNVLAGRALILLGKQLYQKVFKRESSADPNSFFDRLDVEVGGVDTRTGQQTATARYRATDKIRLIGEIGVQGDFRGTVKYLIRFR